MTCNWTRARRAHKSKLSISEFFFIKIFLESFKHVKRYLQIKNVQLIFQFIFCYSKLSPKDILSNDFKIKNVKMKENHHGFSSFRNSQSPFSLKGIYKARREIVKNVTCYNSVWFLFVPTGQIKIGCLYNRQLLNFASRKKWKAVSETGWAPTTHTFLR